MGNARVVVGVDGGLGHPRRHHPEVGAVLQLLVRAPGQARDQSRLPRPAQHRLAGLYLASPLGQVGDQHNCRAIAGCRAAWPCTAQFERSAQWLGGRPARAAWPCTAQAHKSICKVVWPCQARMGSGGRQGALAVRLLGKSNLVQESHAPQKAIVQPDDLPVRLAVAARGHHGVHAHP